MRAQNVISVNGIVGHSQKNICYFEARTYKHLYSIMCRVAVRNTPRARAEPDASAANGPAEDALLLQLETLQPVKQELDLEELFEGERGIDLDAGEH